MPRLQLPRRTTEGADITAVIVAIFRANGRLLKAGDRSMQDLGLTSSRWQVLEAISEKPKTVAQIARDYELARQGVLRVVGGLTDEGLVELADNPRHSRAKLVALTERGRTLHAEVARRQIIWTNEMGTHFTSDALKDLTAGIKKIGELVKQ